MAFPPKKKKTPPKATEKKVPDDKGNDTEKKFPDEKVDEKDNDKSPVAGDTNSDNSNIYQHKDDDDDKSDDNGNDTDDDGDEDKDDDQVPDYVKDPKKRPTVIINPPLNDYFESIVNLPEPMQDHAIEKMLEMYDEEELLEFFSLFEDEIDPDDWPGDNADEVKTGAGINADKLRAKQRKFGAKYPDNSHSIKNK